MRKTCDPHPCVRVTHYGAKAQFLLLVVHPCQEWDALVKCCPGLLQALPCAVEVLERFSSLEADAGTSEWSHVCASKLAGQGIGAVVLEVQVPRGILDLNRSEDKAISPIICQREHSSVIARLREIHREIVQVIENFLRQISRFVDLHSMNSFSNPSLPSLEASEESMIKYIEGWNLPGIRTSQNQREIDLVTRYHRQEVMLSDLYMTEESISTFLRHGYTFAMNKPYCCMPYTLTGGYLSKFRGIAFDIPKHLFSYVPVEEIDFCDVQVDEGKVEQMATVLSEILIASLVRGQEMGA